MERKPAKPRDSDPYAHWRRRQARPERASPAAQLFHVCPAVGEAARHPAAQKNDVGGFAVRDVGGVLSLALGRLSFLLLLDPFSLGFGGFNGGASSHIGERLIAFDIEHLVADFVYFDKLFRRDEAICDEGAVDEKRALVGGGRNRVQPAPPGIGANRRRSLGLGHRIRRRNWRELGRVEVQRLGFRWRLRRAIGRRSGCRRPTCREPAWLGSRVQQVA